MSETPHALLFALGMVVVPMVASCDLIDRPQVHPHPDNVEDESIPAVSSGACDGPDPIPLSEIFDDEGRLLDSPPEEGTLVAVEGIPHANLFCTQKGCNAECCENSCGYLADCAYSLPVGGQLDEFCVAHDDFSCGGTDCSPVCRPFSTDPQNRYRFVGRLEYKEPVRGGGAVLRVDSYCRIDES